MRRIKDILYYFFAEKNWGVRREYGPYVDSHREEHKTNRLKHLLLLLKLNWHYRVRRATTYYLPGHIATPKKDVTQTNTVFPHQEDYILPDILTQSSVPKRYEVAFVAYRPRNSKGGPGNVCNLNQKTLGNIYKGVRLKYFYKVDHYVPVNLQRRIANYSAPVKTVFYATYFVQRELNLWRYCNDKYDLFFVCHDIGSAYGAYLCGRKYVLIFHQQGSLVNETIGAGVNLTDEEQTIIHQIENVVFHHAEKVYFPSEGAKQEYISTCKIDCESVKFGTCLYNAAPTLQKVDSLQAVDAAYNISAYKRDGYKIFLSVGDYNENKGIDRVPELLSRYVEATGEKVLWICAGNRTESGIFERLEQEKDTWSFKAILVGQRLPHPRILAVMRLCDYYVMLHRKSILDIATLEAMQAGLVPILSKTGGNPEFNRDNNIILINCDDYTGAVKQIVDSDYVQMKQKNEEVFNKYFSENAFASAYRNMLDNDIFPLGVSPRVPSSLNQTYLTQFKNSHAGETAVICGGGSSLSTYTPLPGATHIALNSALFCQNVKFDIFFLQDSALLDLPRYNSYPCQKFYGVITNPDLKHMCVKDICSRYPDVPDIYQYELLPRVFDPSIDRFEFDLDQYCMGDAQSVLFSALQFAVYAGFKKILLVGVDFSDTNYDSHKNTSKYARAVVGNLLAFKRQLRDYDETIDLNVINTTNPVIQRSLGVYDQIITVTGVCSEAYEGVLALQKQTCLDSYRYDFQHFTNEEWARMGTSSENDSFWGYTTGLVARVDVTIDRIKKYWGQLLLLMDADIVFLRETEAELLAQIKDRDMMFIKERLDEHNLYERAQRNINIGFVLMRCNEASLKFWEEIRSRVISKRGWDQEETNMLLLEQPDFIKWGFFTDDYCNGGDIKKETVKKKAICTSCGTVARRHFLSKEEYLIKMHNIAIGKSKVWLDGSKM